MKIIEKVPGERHSKTIKGSQDAVPVIKRRNVGLFLKNCPSASASSFSDPRARSVRTVAVPCNNNLSLFTN